MSKHPLTAVLTVSLIIEYEGKILLLRERKDDGVERLMLPGGHVDPGEGILQAAAREAREETGFDIEFGPLVQIIARTLENGTHAVRQTHCATIKGGVLKTEPGVTAEWYSLDEIEKKDEQEFNFGSYAALILARQKKYIDQSSIIIWPKM